MLFAVILYFIPHKSILGADLNYVSDEIGIKKYGVLSVDELNVGLTIFMEVINKGDETLHLVVKMVDCCESITEDETDCTFMNLIGGNMGYLKPNTTKNLTLLYPNMYPYNRRGDCLISVWYRNSMNETREIRHSVPFNTYISASNIPESMKGFRNVKRLLKRCSSPDRDPLDDCNPVDCHMKYNGHRPYYSYMREQCVHAPACYSDPDKELPDVAYLPLSNTCRDLETPITEDDVRYLSKSETTYPTSDWKKLFKEQEDKVKKNTKEEGLYNNVRCHHGKLNPQMGICVCDRGWTSPSLDDYFHSPSTILFHACTIKIRVGTDLLSVFSLESIKSTAADYWLTAFLIISAYVLLMLLLSSYCHCEGVTGAFTDLVQGKNLDVAAVSSSSECIDTMNECECPGYVNSIMSYTATVHSPSSGSKELRNRRMRANSKGQSVHKSRAKTRRFKRKEQ